MSVIKINNNNFDSFIAGDKPVLLDFYADWCGPCRMVGPIVEQIAEERGDLAVGKVNVDRESSLAEKFGVFSIPTLIVLRDGKEIRRAVGAKSKDQLLQLIDA